MSFQIYKISIDGKEYELSRDIGDRKNIISVMTGKNGTGKSRILEFIATNFIISDSFLREYPQNWGPRFNKLIGNYESNQITYTSSGHLIKAQRIHQDMACAFLSENYIENRFNVFPHRLVCLSTSPFDRFPVDTTRKIFNIEDSIYSYIGMKNNQRKISITSLISNVIDTMFKRTERLNVNFSVIKKTLDYLDYGNRLLISYKSNVTIDDISILTFDYISNLLLSLEHEINVNEKSEEWNSIVEDIHVSIHILYDRYNSKWKKTFSIPLNFSKDDVLESDYIKSIQILSRYGLLRISTLKLSQKMITVSLLIFQMQVLVSNV
jgi:hypothetical protein